DFYRTGRNPVEAVGTVQHAEASTRRSEAVFNIDGHRSKRLGSEFKSPLAHHHRPTATPATSGGPTEGVHTEPASPTTQADAATFTIRGTACLSLRTDPAVRRESSGRQAGPSTAAGGGRA